MSRLTLRAPPGYGAVQPLDTRRHAGMGPSAEPRYTWMSRLNAVYLSLPEFGRAALDYPLAFAKAGGRNDEFQPVAVLGMKAGENLFVDDDGRWQRDRYLPAYCRRYPFCIAELPETQATTSQARRLVCVDETGLHAHSQQPWFDRDGAATSAWAPMLQLIEHLETARQQSRALAHRLDALGLLVPFDAVSLPKRGPRSRLQGLYRVNEPHLQSLSGRDLRTLLSKGELRAIYAHLISLENFARLLDLAAQSP